MITYARQVARRDGRQVATLAFVGADGAFAVECELYPVNGMRTEPLKPGPYRFDTFAEAGEFLEEAARSLEYLGCYVDDPDAPADDQEAA